MYNYSVIVGGEITRKLEIKSDYLKSRVVGKLGEKHVSFVKSQQWKKQVMPQEKPLYSLHFENFDRLEH